MIVGKGSQHGWSTACCATSRVMSSTTRGSTRPTSRGHRRARALVLPSWPEGLGRVVIEAFARGRAVVATDAGGIPDLVTERSTAS